MSELHRFSIAQQCGCCGVLTGSREVDPAKVRCSFCAGVKMRPWALKCIREDAERGNARCACAKALVTG
jgi:hypothetical protein